MPRKSFYDPTLKEIFGEVKTDEIATEEKPSLDSIFGSIEKPSLDTIFSNKKLSLDEIFKQPDELRPRETPITTFKQIKKDITARQPITPEEKEYGVITPGRSVKMHIRDFQRRAAQEGREVLTGAGAVIRTITPLLWIEALVSGPSVKIQERAPMKEVWKAIPNNFTKYINDTLNMYAYAQGKQPPITEENFINAESFGDVWGNYYTAITGQKAPEAYKAMAGYSELIGLSPLSPEFKKIWATGKKVMVGAKEVTARAKAIPGIKTEREVYKFFKRRDAIKIQATHLKETGQKLSIEDAEKMSEWLNKGEYGKIIARQVEVLPKEAQANKIAQFTDSLNRLIQSKELLTVEPTATIPKTPTKPPVVTPTPAPIVPPVAPTAPKTPIVEGKGDIISQGIKPITEKSTKEEFDSFADRLIEENKKLQIGDEIWENGRKQGVVASISGKEGNEFIVVKSEITKGEIVSGKLKTFSMLEGDDIQVIRPTKAPTAKGGEMAQKVYVHETNAPSFDKFDLSKVGTGQGEAWLGRGIYLNEKGSFKIEQYGKNKVEATLKPKAKIFVIEETPKGLYRDTFVEWAIKNDVGNARALAKEAESRDIESDKMAEITGRPRDKNFTSKKNILPRDILRNHPEVVERLKKEGYDGLDQDGELVVYNPDVLTKLSPKEGGVGDITKAIYTKEFGFTGQGLKEVIVDMPIEDIPKRSTTTPEYRDEKVVAMAGRKVTKPIIAMVEDINNPESAIEIVDGWHRYRQALANKDKTIKVKMIFSPPKAEPTKAPEVKGKKQTLISVIKERGGIDTESIKKDYNWNEDVKQSKVPISIFKKGASGLDDMAGQLQAEGIIQVPENMNPGDYLMQQLKDAQARNAELYANDLDKQYQKEYTDLIESKEGEGYEEGEIREAEREIEADLEKETQSEVDKEEIPDWVTDESAKKTSKQYLQEELDKKRPISKADKKRFDNNIPLIEKELRTDLDRHPAAIIANYGFTFYDDIAKLRRYAEETNHPLVVMAIDEDIAGLEKAIKKPTETLPTGEKQEIIPGLKREMPKGKKKTEVPQEEDVLREMKEKPKERQITFPGLGKPMDLGAPGKLRGIDTFEGVDAGSKQVELRLFEETKKIAKKYAGIIGEKYVPGKFLGIFYPKTENIFVRALNNISTTIHEVVHYIDAKNGMFGKIGRKTGVSKTGNPIYAPETRVVRKALTEVYIQFYPLGKKTHKLEKRVREGLAEFIENYVAQPTAMKEKFPVLYKEFLVGGDYFDPMLPALVKDARDLIGAYQKLDPLKKVGAKILSDDQPISQSFMKFHEKLIQEFADNIYPLEKMAKESGVRWTERDPSLWTRLYNNLSGIISHNIDTNKGYVHFKNENLVKLYDYNWKTLIEGLKKDKLTDDFAYWLVARREYFAYDKLDKLREEAKKVGERIKELGELIKTSPPANKEYKEQLKPKLDDYKRLASILAKDGFSRDIVTQAYNQYSDQFAKQAEQFDNLVRADLDFLRDMGLVTEKNYQEFIENEGYATFKRDVYNEIIGDAGEVRGVTRTGTRVSSLKGRTGSELTIINPLYSSIKNHAEIMKKGIKQLILNKIYNLRSHFPDFMQEIPLVRAPRLGGGFNYPQDKDPNILMAMQGGKRKPLLVSKEIMTVINEILNWKNIHLFERLAIKASRMFTKGTTGLYPPFAIQNFFVDQITATAQTTTKYTPVIDQLNILYKQLTGHGKQADYLREYLMLGGQRHTFVGWLDMNPNEYFTAITKEKNAIQKVGDLLEQGAQLIGTPTQFSEILTRAVEYIKARELGQPQVVALERAGRVSAPFHHVGRWGGQTTGRTLIKSIPYFNASLQVLAQFTRTLKDPKTRKRAVFVVMALTAAIVGGFMAILKKGTEEQKRIYKELHPRELAHYIYFPSPNGRTLLRLRVPEQMSAIATLINMSLADALMDTRYSNKEYVDAVTAWVPDQFNVTDPVRQFFSWMPHAIGPTTEVLMNKRTYPKIMPIEGMNMESHEKQFRYNKQTGWLAKYVGKHLNVSPRKVDYLIEQMIGRTSKFIKGGKITNPVVREEYFSSGRRLVEFYELRKAIEQKFYSIKNKLREFTPEEKAETLKLYYEIGKVSKMLSAYNKLSEDEENKIATEKLKQDILNRIDSFRYTR